MINLDKYQSLIVLAVKGHEPKSTIKEKASIITSDGSAEGYENLATAIQEYTGCLGDIGVRDANSVLMATIEKIDPTLLHDVAEKINNPMLSNTYSSNSFFVLFQILINTIRRIKVKDISTGKELITFDRAMLQSKDGV